VSRAHSLSVDADLEQLKTVRSFINETGQALDIDADTLGEICLVVDEAVTNVILHGYDGKPGRIDIEMLAEQDDLVIHVRDQAPVFTAEEVETPHLDEALSERAYGGMGVYLIRKLTDEAEFHPLPGKGNELRLVRRGVVRRSR
jgi:anti-sigma regulatory factor (Ser/Thr protein kinase)